MNRQQHERHRRIEEAQNLYRGCLLMLGGDDIDSACYRKQVIDFFETCKPDAPEYAAWRFYRSFKRWLKQANRRKEIEDG